MILALTAIAPILGAWLPVAALRRGRDPCAWAAAAVTGLALVLLLLQAPAVFRGEVLRDGWDWIPAVGLRLTFMLDGLGLLFALLILCMGLLIILYARYYISPEDPLGRFYALLLVFQGAMLGIVLSENVLLLLMFWELTSLSSFLLIGYWSGRADARQGARLALTLTGGGGLALLGGLLLLGDMAGSYELGTILDRGAEIQGDPRYPLALVLILLGAFTKSAQFPFHFWLPAAMAAPTPVSAYLHSATMVKAGVFLLARLFPALAGSDAWFYIVGGTGMVTLVYAAWLAMYQHDLKGLLAYSTISHLGLITLLLGMGTPLAAVAGVFHIINHAIFKASLFMAAGIIDHETGTRDMRRINGLWKYMPHTTALAIIAAGSMAGVPLLNGFLSKEMFLSETLSVSRLGDWGWILPAFATLGTLLSVAYSARFVHDVFFNGEPVNLPKSPHEPPRYMKIPVEILVALVLLVGMFPAFTVGPILAVAAGAAVHAPLPYYSLDVWHGFTLPLAMSAAAFIGGITLYTQRHRLFRFHDQVLPEIDAPGVFERVVAAGLGAAGRLTSAVENGSLQRYLLLLILSGLVLGMFPWLQEGAGAVSMLAAPTPWDGVSAAAWLAVALSCAAVVIYHRRRLRAVIALSVVGLVVALAFARLSAPDLALTQLSVELATIILILLALYFLPARSPRESSPARRLRDGLIATVGGTAIGIVAWLAMLAPTNSISDYYLAHSVPDAGGHNVVNVILVDFRGFDTLGEITVLAIAALGIFALLGNLHLERWQIPDAGRPSKEFHPLILQTVSRLLLPLALVVSLYLLLRGHNEPGGGFIGGLVTAIALILQYVASGSEWASQRGRVGHRMMVAAGLLIAFLTGAASLLFDAPFLTSTFAHVHLPIIGDFEVASAMAFDIGVYLTVVGSVMLILARLGRLSGASHAVGES